MFRPQNLSPLEREKRLIFEGLKPMEDPEGSGLAAPGEGESDVDLERKRMEPKTDAEKAIAAFSSDAEKSSAERTHDAVEEKIGTEAQQNLYALEAQMEKRRKGWRIPIFTEKKTDDELLSEEFDTIAKATVKKLNEGMLGSESEAIQQIAKIASKTGEEFMLLDHKCSSLKGYLKACKEKLKVYQSERDRFERLLASLRNGENSVFAEEISQIQSTIDNIELVLAQETEKAKESAEHEQVAEIRKQDSELRKLLLEENQGFFSGKNLTKLIVEAVGGNPEPLEETIREGVKDEAKLEVFLATVDSLVAVPEGLVGRMLSRLPHIRWVNEPKELRAAKEGRRKALAYHYTTQIVTTLNQIRSDSIDERLAALKDLPVGSRVDLYMEDPNEINSFTVTGKQTAPGEKKEYVILRNMKNEAVVAVDIQKKTAIIRPDPYTESMVVNLGVQGKGIRQGDTTVLYLSASKGPNPGRPGPAPIAVAPAVAPAPEVDTAAPAAEPAKEPVDDPVVPEPVSTAIATISAAEDVVRKAKTRLKKANKRLKLARKSKKGSGKKQAIESATTEVKSATEAKTEADRELAEAKAKSRI